MTPALQVNVDVIWRVVRLYERGSSNTNIAFETMRLQSFSVIEHGSYDVSWHFRLNDMRTMYNNGKSVSHNVQ